MTDMMQPQPDILLLANCLNLIRGTETLQLTAQSDPVVHKINSCPRPVLDTLWYLNLRRRDDIWLQNAGPIATS